MNTSNSIPATPTIFQFNQKHQVRVIQKENDPWFCLTDICKILDVDRSSQLIKSLDKKGWFKNLTLTDGGNQDLVFVSEPNLYRVIFRSNKPEAKQFQDWVFNDVLPAIRKTGSYNTPEPTEPPDYIHWRTHARIRHIINSIADRFHFSGSWSFGIHHRLRKITGSKSPQPFETKHLGIIANELIRIIGIANVTRDISREFESNVVKHLVRDGKALEEIESLLADAQHQQQILLNDLDKDFLLKYQTQVENYHINDMNDLLKLEENAKQAG